MPRRQYEPILRTLIDWSIGLYMSSVTFHLSLEIHLSSVFFVVADSNLSFLLALECFHITDWCVIYCLHGN